MNTEAILQTINEIEATVKSRKYIRDKKNGKNVYLLLREKYKEFVDTFPTLFDMAVEGDVDKDKLKAMFSMQNRVATNQLTERDASEKIAQLFLGDFIAKFKDKEEAAKASDTAVEVDTTVDTAVKASASTD